MKNKKYIISDKEFDKMIKKSIETEMNDGKDVITDEELLAMGYTLPPEDIPQRIMAEHANEGKVGKRTHTTVRKLIIAVATLGILLATMSVSGVRFYVFNIVSEIRQNSIQFFGTNKSTYEYDVDEALAYENAEKELGVSILKPGYLPDGFEFEKIRVYVKDCVIMNYGKGDNIIRITQKLLIDETETGEMVDINDGDMYILKAQDAQIKVERHVRKETEDEWLSAVWDNENISYRVEGNINQKEFEKFIKKLK
ncbi:MAG: DUF4367 domain-containing protein [Clostridia bacterium]|nr:DUF4367 domain-containing protein [Clostridia bacterium]